MRLLARTAILLASLTAQALAQDIPVGYTAIRDRAEKLHQEGSYELARKLYAEAAALELPADDARWVAFRLADCGWRSAVASRDPDTSRLDGAREKLEEMYNAVGRPEERDRVWAEIAESLGDLHWTRERNWNMNGALGYYRPALEWWAVSRDLELARTRWLDMVWRLAEPGWYGGEDYGHYGNWVPLDLLEDALSLAREESESSRAHYLLARSMSRQSQGKWWDERAAAHYDAVLELGAKHDWYDDALHHYAEWLSNTGRWRRDGQGNLARVADLPGALVLYRRIVGEYREGDSRWRNHAKGRIEFITAREVGVAVQQSFLPESKVAYDLWWRNVSRVDLALYRVDLARTVQLADPIERAYAWLHKLELDGIEPLRRWSHTKDDLGDHQTQRARLELDDVPGIGAYVLTAEAGGKGAREIILISDASLVAKTSADQMLVWATGAERGAPIAGARGRVWTRSMDSSGNWSWSSSEFTTGDDGTARVATGIARRGEHFACIEKDGHQAYVTVNSRMPNKAEGWRIYATTDRPAYRPDQDVHWKVLVRRFEELSYTTPAEEKLQYFIHGPRGEDIEQGELVLNAFGSAWGELRTKPEMMLGEYRVTFQSGGENIGQATLFRLEEYKLPEFQVTVHVPDDEADPKRKRVFVVGDEIEAEVQAEYYFGGAVSDAEVEVVVYQGTWWRPHPVPRRWGWFEDALRPNQGSWRGNTGRNEVLRKKLRTDAAGRVAIAFPSAENQGERIEYTIEARVVDASRREVTGTGRVRVTRQSYDVQIELEHRLHAPGKPLTARFHARDANEHPVSTEGEARLLRARWIDVWRDPTGKLVQEKDLTDARRQHVHFPPSGWQQIRAEYAYELVDRSKLTTDGEGEVTWTVTPPGTGAYVVRWHADDPRGGEVTAEQWVWVVSDETRELDYHGLAVQIILDDEAFEEGRPGSMMIVTDTGGRHVLLTFEVGRELHHQVLDLSGTVRLVTFDVREEHVPNFFVSATMIDGGEMHSDAHEVIVPPVKRFLDVTVQTERETYLPGEEAQVEVRVTDSNGEPVAAEVALAVADEAVVAIQQDYAPDPRAFFFGHPRRSRVQTSSTMHAKAYVRLVEKGESLIDERQASLWDEDDGRDLETFTMAPGSVPHGGGVGGGPRSGHLRRDSMRKSAGRSETRAFAPAGEAMQLAQGADAPAEGAGGAGTESVVVRSDFRETALWRPDLVTGDDGRGTCTLEWPDSTTSWRATARASSRAAHFGQVVRSAARTSMPLVVRLQTPRFFIAGDEATIAALVDNNTESGLEFAPALMVEGLEVLGWLDGDELRPGRPVPRTIDAGGQERVEWRVRAREVGEAQLVAQVLSGELTDAMERKLPVHEYGLEVFSSDAGKLTAAKLEHVFDLPAERRPGSTRMTVSVTPSIATTMLDALPYLVRYPYGCTEQTLSRFVPAVVVQKTLQDLGVSKELVASAAFGGIEAAFTDKTQPQGKEAYEELERVIADGLARIEGAQRSDGSWGWWPGGSADPYMSAYAVWALTLAKEAGVDVSDAMIRRGAAWVEEHIVEAETRPDLAAWMMHAVAARLASLGRQSEHNRFMVAGRDTLWRQRDELNAYSRALFALACHDMGWDDQALTLARNIANGVQVDADPGSSGLSGADGGQRARTAHWGDEGVVWRWSSGGVEATAFCLQALMQIDPDNALVAPAMTWLVQNRRGAQWKSTKDTSIVVLALADYLRASGELSGTAGYRLTVNGEELASVQLTGEEMLDAPSTFVVEAPRDGANTIVLERTSGDGPLYWTVGASFFSVEDPIPARAADLFVRRDVFRLVERPTLLRGSVFDRVRLEGGDEVVSGDRLEVVLTVEAKNHLEYLVFEDHKAAGLEATELKSGGPFYATELRADEVTHRFGAKDGDLGGAQLGDRASHSTQGITGRTRWVHRELRDEKVALFVDRMPEGVWEMRYTLRAETPGIFRALPTAGQAMYVPEIRGNSTGLRVRVLP
ncbi:MAG: alpha-2-macroglobulin [bacterium]|nr:alpha-2-macroglobulin [bacterium]